MSALEINKVIYFRYNLPWKLKNLSFELQFRSLKKRSGAPREYCIELIEYYTAE